MDKSFCTRINSYNKIPYFKNIIYKHDYVKTKLTELSLIILSVLGQVVQESTSQLTI